jgi:endonuclease I
MRLAWVILAVAVAGCAATDEQAAPTGGGGGKADDGKSETSLRDRLHDEVADHVALSYFDARHAMFNMIDVRDGMIESIYTGKLVAPDGSNTPGGFNTEHVWPQSQGAEEEPPRSDLHHIFPVDAESNSARASFPFGEAECNDADQSGPATACAWQAAGSALELASDKITGTFEVRPERRGDVARAKFYFAIRYELPIDDDQEATLRAWHADDPPDDVERDRDDAIAEIQHNHNPFVVDPDLVDELADF